jgi:hypothetical protein
MVPWRGRAGCHDAGATTRYETHLTARPFAERGSACWVRALSHQVLHLHSVSLLFSSVYFIKLANLLQSVEYQSERNWLT